MSVPLSISYRNIKPIGIPSRVRKTTFYPHNIYGGSIKGGDTVKFHIKAPTFWDPYNCFIKMKVSFEDAEPECVQQIDGSAHSFIKEMIVSAGNQEIERIQEYDVLANMLMDNAHSNDTRMSKSHEGLSSEVLQANNFNIITQQDSTIIPTNFGEDKNARFFTATHGFKPTISQSGSQFFHAPATVTKDTYARLTSYVADADAAAKLAARKTVYDNFKSLIAISSDLGSHPRELGRLSNPVNCIVESFTYGEIDASIRRADNTFISCRRRSHPGKFKPIVKYPYSKDDITKKVNVSKFSTTNTLSSMSSLTVEEVELPNYWANMNDHQEFFSDEIDPPTVGNVNIFNREYAAGCFEDCFSNSFKQYVFENGRLTNPIVKLNNVAEYTIPLLSGVLGILLPRDNYKLFPAFAVDNLQLEFKINPEAVFTSGYKKYLPPVPDADKVYLEPTDHDVYQPLTTQLKRAFKIVEFEIVVDLIQFDDSITDLMRAQLAGDGIILSTSTFALGPLYNLQTYYHVAGNHQVNMGFESLKNIFIMYLSNDYQEYTFCRKNYRLSRNITSLQAKIGLDYYPDKPIEGHGGNPNVPDRGSKNNWPYVHELWRTFAHMNETNSHTIVNRHNFAIDERCYDVTNKNPYYSKTYPLQEYNIDTAMGYPLIHENRACGRAIYVLNFSFNADSGTSLNGINTIQNRPFDIQVQNDKTPNALPVAKKDRPCTMYIFCHYDMIVQISLSGVRVLGRA